MSRSGALYQVAGQSLGAPGLRTGYHTSQFFTAFTTATNPADGRAQFSPLVVANTAGVTVQGLAVFTTLAATSGGLARLGLYSADANGLPSALVIDGGTVDATATAGRLEVAANFTLPRGFYWTCVVPQGTPTTQATYRASSAPLNTVPDATTLNTPRGGYLTAGGSVPGALPSSVPAFSANGAPVAMWLNVV